MTEVITNDTEEARAMQGHAQRFLNDKYGDERYADVRMHASTEDLCAVVEYLRGIYGSYAELGRQSPISSASWWRVGKRCIESDLVRGFLLLPSKPVRTRIAADVTETQRARLHGIATENGCASWSEFCQRLADDDLVVRERVYIYAAGTHQLDI